MAREERVTVTSRSCADRDMLAAVVAVVDDAAAATAAAVAVSRRLPLRGVADGQPSQLRGLAAAAAAAVENVEDGVAWEPLRLCLLWERWWRRCLQAGNIELSARLFVRSALQPTVTRR